jgi:hypothetical protein
VQELNRAFSIPSRINPSGGQKGIEAATDELTLHYEQEVDKPHAYYPINRTEMLNKTNNIAHNIISVTSDEEQINNCANKFRVSKQPRNLQNESSLRRSISKESVTTLVQRINRKGGITFIVIVALALFGVYINQSQRDQLATIYLKGCGLVSLLLVWYWISARNEIRVATNKIMLQMLEGILCGKLSLASVSP